MQSGVWAHTSFCRGGAGRTDKCYIGVYVLSVDISKDWLAIARHDRADVERIENTTTNAEVPRADRKTAPGAVRKIDNTYLRGALMLLVESGFGHSRRAIEGRNAHRIRCESRALDLPTSMA